MVGTQLGAYRVLRLIGQGGMGAVWLAEHTILGRRAAIKVLHSNFTARPDIVTRFFNEARAATAVPDPGIVQIFDFGYHVDGSAYIAMEMLDGEPLDRRLYRLGRLIWSDALRVMRQVASTLGVVHLHGIVHRDLKPENIFLVRDPEVVGGERAKILDFGIAKLTGGEHANIVDIEIARLVRDQKTGTAAMMGTPAYMSPEQCRGAGQVDQRSDVYALGCVLFALLTGAPPFEADGSGEIIAMHLREPPPAPSSRAAAIPPEVDAVVLRCLAKDPEERYASAGELAAAIGRVLGIASGASSPGASADPGRASDSFALTRYSSAGRLAGDGPPRTATRATGIRADRSVTPVPRSVGRRGLLMAIALAIVGGGAAAVAVMRIGARPPPASAAPAAPSSAQPASPAVAPSAVPAAVAEPVAEVELPFEYSTEKEDWLDAALAEFQRANPRIHVTPISRASLDAVNAILDGKDQPVLWSPSDSLATGLLASDWQARQHSELYPATGEDAPQPLLLTPLVFVVWEERARLLADPAGQLSWKTIRKAVASPRGWAAIGGKPAWGTVKLGHADPDKANSGLQSLVSMAHEYFQTTSELTAEQLLDPKFRGFVRELERAVPDLESSTGAFMTDMIRFGPSKYDIAVVYESIAVAQLKNAQGRWGSLHIYYPPVTIWSDHPIVLLNAPWVTPDQKRAAAELIAFLRSPRVQATALRFGFRPADTSVPMKVAEPNLFAESEPYGFSLELPSAARPLDGPAVRALLTTWSRTGASKQP